jgi:hypothetical protein
MVRMVVGGRPTLTRSIQFGMMVVVRLAQGSVSVVVQRCVSLELAWNWPCELGTGSEVEITGGDMMSANAEMNGAVGRTEGAGFDSWFGGWEQTALDREAGGAGGAGGGVENDEHWWCSGGGDAKGESYMEGWAELRR